MRLSCRAVSKNLRPTCGGAREGVTGKVRSDITAIVVVSQLRPESISDSGGDFPVAFSLMTLGLSTSSLGFFS